MDIGILKLKSDQRFNYCSNLLSTFMENRMNTKCLPYTTFIVYTYLTI